MTEAEYSASEASFSTHLRRLRHDREERKEASRSNRPARQLLRPSERAHILAKTAGRCHICGGIISDSAWHADHVLAHSAGGTHDANNYLPAHALCNKYRWDYSAEEFQLILKLGVWTRTQIERRTALGRQAAAAFLAHEHTRQARRKEKGDTSAQQ
jgi:5-methylcytosine-specific restriction endonuclease McrA